MRPVLLELRWGEAIIAIGSYRFFGILAAIYLLLVALLYLKFYRMSIRWILVSSLVVAGAFLLGARGLHSLMNLSETLNNPASIFTLQLKNFTLFGGLALSFLAWRLLAGRAGLPFWKLTDRFVFHAGIGLALMRLGCFLNGCCYGRITDMPWGISFPRGGLAHLNQVTANPLAILRPVQPVHPTQLYEMGAALLASLMAWKIMQGRTGRPERAGRPGLATAVFGLVLSGGRLIIYFFRNLPADNAASLMRGPGIYGAAMLVFASWIVVSLREVTDK